QRPGADRRADGRWRGATAGLAVQGGRSGRAGALERARARRAHRRGSPCPAGVPRVSAGFDEARTFAESVAGVVDRATPARAGWAPGQVSEPWPQLEGALQAVDWAEVATDAGLVDFAALGALELG